jgi:phospholipid/cholesterol/gamma-HCH transport system substrate-binding protein
MKKTGLEISVGIFVLLGLACTAYLTVKLGKLEILGGEYYTINAKFSSVSGLKDRATVEMAGVPIGRVEAITLDDNLDAIVKMKIDKAVELTDDVIASIKTSGLIGDKFVQIQPGGSDVILNEGDMVYDTEPALDIEALIGKFAYGDAAK